MQTKLLRFLEARLNAYLHSDEEVASRLHAYAGKVIEISVEDIQLHFYLTLGDNSIFLNNASSTKADAVIAGKSFSLLHMWLSQQPAAAAVHDLGIRLEGDVLLIQHVRAILSAVRVDWQEKVAQYTSDTFAHKLDVGVLKFKKILSQQAQLFCQNLSEYLQEELQLFPTKHQVQDWYQDVADIHNDVERMQAKVDRLWKLLQ